MQRSTLLATTFAATLVAGVSAQTPPPSVYVNATLDSGYLANPGAQPSVVYQHRLNVPVSDWLQLHFTDHTNLPEGSFLRMTAKRDNGMQRHDGRTLFDWENVSAMFNGDEILIELVAAPGSAANRLVIDGYWQGAGQMQTPESICGVDNRVQSFDPRQGRLWLGCTGWMIGQDVMLTAGHCTTTGTRILELNVPLSTAGGSVVRANPIDQYPYTELAGLNAGIGSDWRVCRVGRNSTSGLLPTDANGGQWYGLGTVPASTAGQNIRITGFGVDSDTPTFSQVEQTHVGPLSTISATSLCYATDTTGGTRARRSSTRTRASRSASTPTPVAVRAAAATTARASIAAIFRRRSATRAVRRLPSPRTAPVATGFRSPPARRPCSAPRSTSVRRVCPLVYSARR